MLVLEAMGLFVARSSSLLYFKFSMEGVSAKALFEVGSAEYNEELVSRVAGGFRSFSINYSLHVEFVFFVHSLVLGL